MAEILGGILEQCGDSLPPERLVEIARPVRSPIHNLFTWDDARAAYLFRVRQARDHIAHLEIIIIHEEKPFSTKAYHAVVIDREKPHEKQYTTLEAIMNSPDLSLQVVRQAKLEANRWRRKYRDYASIFGGVFREIDKVLGAGD